MMRKVCYGKTRAAEVHVVFRWQLRVGTDGSKMKKAMAGPEGFGLYIIRPFIHDSSIQQYTKPCPCET